MQFELAHPSCPLCKRQLPAASAGQAPGTRLCEPCQSLIVTAFRSATPIVADAAPVVEPRAAIKQLEDDSLATNQVLSSAPSFFEDFSTVSHSSVPESPQLGTIEEHDEKFAFFEDQDPDLTIHHVESGLAGAPEDESSSQRDQPSDWVAPSIVANETQADRDFVQPTGSNLSEQPGVLDPADDTRPARSSVVEDQNKQQPAVDVAVAGNPVDDQLAEWDYAQSEWPVFVVPTSPWSYKSRRVGIAAALLLAFIAGIYFLIYLPSSPDRPTTGPSATASAAVAAEPRASASGTSDSDDRKKASTPEAPSPPSQAAVNVASPAGVSSESSNTQSRFSLQAAAFPTAGGADEFAEKLKQAGVPSYVVPAELARRGRWFRVRVGRFNSADEAQKFAGDVQLRARAAGLALQLIVCQYDQP